MVNDENENFFGDKQEIKSSQNAEEKVSIQEDISLTQEQIDKNDSFFAETTAKEEILKESEPQKRVRGSMLKTLLKYDYRALFKFLLPCYIILISLAGLCCGAIYFINATGDQNSSISTIGFNIFANVATTYAICVVACSTVCIFNIAVRFLKNLFSGEGYLTLTLPATSEEHIFSKVISGYTTILLTILVAALSLFIVSIPFGLDNVFTIIKNSFSSLSQYLNGGWITIAEGILFALIWILFQLQAINCCICIGQTFVNKNRAATGAIAFVLYYILTQVVSTIITLTGIFSSVGTTQASVHIFLWGYILFLVGLNIGAFFLQRHILKNKVNLA